MILATALLVLAAPMGMAPTVPVETPAPLKAPILRVGFVAGQYPCSYLEQGIWKGSAVELWSAAAERTKLPFIVQRAGTPQQAIDSLVRGQLDVAVSCFNLTQERLRKVGYTTPYRFEGIKILGKAKEFDLVGILTRAIKDVRLPRALALLFGTTLLITAVTVWLERKLVDAIFAESLSAKNFTRLWLLITIGPSPLEKTSRLNTATLLAFSHYVRIIFSGALIAAITAAAIGESIESDGQFKITGFADLHGLRIGVADGSYAEARIRETIKPSPSSQAGAANTIVMTYGRREDLADALRHDQVDVIAGDAAAMEELGRKLSAAGHYFIYGPELAKTPQGFLVAPSVPKAIDAALDDAVLAIETERSQEPKP